MHTLRVKNLHIEVDYDTLAILIKKTRSDPNPRGTEIYVINTCDQARGIAADILIWLKPPGEDEMCIEGCVSRSYYKEIIHLYNEDKK